MGIEISPGQVGKVRGAAWPGTLLGPPYTNEQSTDYFCHAEPREESLL
jgi:hypothetical protein